jgi:predicted Fe-Mo cluster-binding NifX family protein
MIHPTFTVINMRIAAPTTGKRKLSNKVSDTFSHADEFTIVTIRGHELFTEVIANPGKSYSRGAGPITAKALSDHNIDLVLTSEIGPGLIEILRQHGINYRIVESGQTVKEALASTGIFIDHGYGDSPQ